MTELNRFDARRLARAWLGVACASGKDERPAFNRTVLVELARTGARLVATDGALLLHAWVPPLGREDSRAPGFDEMPDVAVVAMDPHARGKGLMAHLLSICGDEDNEPTEVTIGIGRPNAPPTRTAQFDDIEARAVLIEYEGHEQVALEIYEGEWTDWRGILTRQSPEAVETIALNPDLLGRFNKLGKLYNGAPAIWTFGGSEGMARVVVAKDDVGTGSIEGGIMPVRLS